MGRTRSASLREMGQSLSSTFREFFGRDLRGNFPEFGSGGGAGRDCASGFIGGGVQVISRRRVGLPGLNLICFGTNEVLGNGVETIAIHIGSEGRCRTDVLIRDRGRAFGGAGGSIKVSLKLGDLAVASSNRGRSVLGISSELGGRLEV